MFHYIQYEAETSELSHKPAFFFNNLRRGAHLLCEFLRKDSLFCSLLVFQPSCHLGGERINKARLPASSGNAGWVLPPDQYENTRRNSRDQDSEATTSLSALPGTRLARDHFLWTVRRWPAQTLSLNIYNVLSQ